MYALIGVFCDRRNVMRENNTLILRRPFQYSWIICSQQSNVLNTDHIGVRCAPTHASYNIVVEIFVYKEAQHWLLLR
jgi:hypothetical protein